jgi:hypothetical protein
VSLTLDAAAGIWNAEVDLLTALRDRENATIVAWPQHIKFHMTQEQHEQVLKTGVVIESNPQVPTGAVSFRVVVRDATTGAVGSVDLPLL